MDAAAEAHARVFVHRRKNLWPACNGSGVWHNRLSYPPRSSCAADDRPRAFPEMNASSAPVASIGDAGRPGSTIPAATLLAAWRAFAVVFFSACALAEIMAVILFVGRERRLTARTEWLHRWCRFACRVLGIRVTTHGAMPRSGLLVCNHLSYLDIIVLSSIRPCIFVAKRDVAGWPLFGWLAHAAATSGAPIEVHPYFREDTHCSVCELMPPLASASGREHRFRVFLPPGYYENTLKKYPVLYMHDGHNLFFKEEAFAGNTWRADEVLTMLDKMNAIEEVIAVGIHPNERMTEYTLPGYEDY